MSPFPYAMKPTTLFVLSLGLLSFAQGDLHAATWIGGVGDWSNSANWDGGDRVDIARVHSGTASVTTTERSDKVEISSGGSVIVDEGSLYGNGTTIEYYVSTGLDGTGSLTVRNGGSISTGQVVFGGNATGTGYGAVTGAGSSIEAGSEVIIGFSGVGHVTIENGGALTAEGLLAIAGFNTTTESTLIVTGEGSLLETNYQLQVGYSGKGRLTVEEGALVDANDVIYISAHEDSQGRIDVTTGGRIEGSSYLVVGAVGPGELNVTDGGEVKLEGPLAVGAYTDNAASQGTVLIDGGASKVEAVDTGVGNGSITVRNGGTLVATSWMAIGTGWGDGSLLVESGGEVTAGNLIIGAADAAGPTPASGQVTVQGLESALYATSLQIGNVTDGDLEIRAGGTVSVTGDVDLGQADAVGSLLIEGSGSSLSFNERLRLQGAGASVEVMDGGLLSGSTVELANGSQLTVGNTAGSGFGVLAVDTIRGHLLSEATLDIVLDSASTGSFFLTQDGTETGDAIAVEAGVKVNIFGGTVIFQNGNTYDHGTTVNSGALIVRNSGSTSATGSGAVTVHNAGALGGTGRIGGSVSVSGLIDPSLDVLPALGTTLTIGGDLELLSTSTFGVLGGVGSIYSISVGGTATISQLATLSLNITDPLTLNSYTLLNAIDGIVDNTADGFILDGVIPTGFELVYSEYRVELVRLPAQFGTVTATPEESEIIIGGTTRVVVTVGNSAPEAHASLEGTVSGGSGNVTGSGTASVAPGDTGTAVDAPGDPLTFTGSVVGTESGTVVVTDPDATGNPGGDTFEVTVYGHAIADVSDTTLHLGYLHAGYTGPVTSNSIDITNGEAGDFIVDLKGSGAVSDDLSLNAFGGLAAGDTTQVTATLQEGRGVGAINETLTYAFGDDSTLNGALDNFGSVDITVTGEVYSGHGVWNTEGGGSWGTLESGFGVNWQAGGGSPGLDAAFATTDTATFGAAGSGVIRLDGATPSLRAITFDNASAEYQLREGSGGTIALNAGADTATITNLNGSHLIAVPMELVSDTRVEVAQANDRLTIQGLLSGTGSLTIAGNGRTVFNSHQAYSGPTTVESGSLASHGLANSRLILNGGTYSPHDLGVIGEGGVDVLELNGGALEFDLGDQTADRIGAINDVFLNAATHFDFNDAGFTSGVYELIWAWQGALYGFDDLSLLTFSSSNIDDLEGLFAMNDESTALYFRAWRTGETIGGDVLSNSVPYLIPTTATFGVEGRVTTLPSDRSVTISALTFAPASSLTGSNQVFVTSGGIQLGDGPALISGLTVTGTQPVVVSGPGTLVLARDTSLTSPGVLTLASGGIVIQGSLRSTAGVYLTPGATAFGSGVVTGNFINAGSLRPGNSPGTFTVTGDYIQPSTGALYIEVASNDHDRLVVGGTATLGGTLDVSSYGGHQFAYGDEVTFLYASTIEGEFDRIISPDASRFRIRFLEDDGEGSILFAPTSYTLVARTPNERSTAKALDGFIDAEGGDRQTVSLALDHLTEGEYANAFQQVSPAFYSSMTSLVLSQANTYHQSLAQRLDHQRLAGVARGFSSNGIEAPISIDRNGKSVVATDKNPTLLEATPENRWSVWVEGNGAFTKVPNALQIGDKQYRGGGFLVGSDYQWSDFLTTGLFGGYQGVRADYGSGNRIALDSALFGGYAAWQAGGFHGNAIISGGQHQFDVRRSIRFGSIDRQAHSDPQGRQFNAYLDLGRDIQFSGFTFSPIVAGQYSYANLSSFSEDGANSLNLNVRRQEAHSLRSDLGARLAYTAVVTSDVLVIPEVRATWNHEFLDTDRTLGSTFSGAPGQAMSYTTTGQERESVNLGAGVSAHINQSWNVSLFYNANLGRESSDTSHALTGSVGWKF